MFLLLFLVSLDSNPKITFGTSYELPSLVSDYALGDAHSMCFTANGNLYIVDRTPSIIHHWDARGKYLGAFGKKGEGPGEMNFPVYIAPAENAVWVWDFSQKVSGFKLDGTFIRSFKFTGRFPWRFATLGDDQFLMTYRKRSGSKKLFNKFDLVAKDGAAKTIKEYENDYILTPVQGRNNSTVKAFASESDIQKGPDGTLWLGFSGNKNLVHLDKSGKILETRSFELTTAPPTEGEKERFLNISFPNPQGGDRIAFKSMPNLKLDFSRNKAYYTSFLIKGDRVAFILTPIGSLNGPGNGYSWGSWSVNDMNTGKRLSVGRFDFPEDSQVFIRDGRLLGLIQNDEDYEINELFIKDF